LPGIAPARTFARMNRLCILLLALTLHGHAFAQETVPPDAPAAEAGPSAEGGPAIEGGPPGEPPPPIYEEKLLRLAEILGSLSFLRDLCGGSDGAAWREEMTGLLAAEQPLPLRRRRLIARFNHGFETYNAVYRSCTPSAQLAITRYLAEGQTLASDVRSRYSQ